MKGNPQVVAEIRAIGGASRRRLRAIPGMASVVWEGAGEWDPVHVCSGGKGTDLREAGVHDGRPPTTGPCAICGSRRRPWEDVLFCALTTNDPEVTA